MRLTAMLLLLIFTMGSAAEASALFSAPLYAQRTIEHNEPEAEPDGDEDEITEHPWRDNEYSDDYDDNDENDEPEDEEEVKEPVEVTSVKLNTNTLEIKTKETVTLTAQCLPSNADDKSIIWHSSDEEIVEVTADGEVTGISEGTATISAISLDVPWVFDICEVTVERDYLSTIALGRNAVKLSVGSMIPLAVITAPDTAYDPTYTWTCDDEDVAEILPGNVIRALKPGVATFTVTANDHKEDGRPAENRIVVTVISAADYFCTVGKIIAFKTDIITENPDSLMWNVYRLTNDSRVNALANEVSIATNKLSCRFFGHAIGEYRVEITDPDDERNMQIIHINVKEPVKRVIAYLEDNPKRRRAELTVNRDGTDPSVIKLSATVEPDTATYKDVLWRSSKPDVATVDENGVVTPISVGSTVITCTSATDNKKSNFTISVKLNPTEITLDKTGPITMRVGTSTRLKATVDKFKNSSSVIVWSSSNPDAVTVSNGKLTAVGAGTAVITAASAGGNVSASIEVEAVILPSRLVSANRSIELSVGQSGKFDLSFEPSNSTETALVYESRDSSVATVDEYGNITAVGAGTTSVTAATVNGKKASVIVVVR